MKTKQIKINREILGLIVYLSQRQYNSKQLILRADWLDEFLDTYKPHELTRAIALKALNALRPSDRKALVLWVRKKIRPTDEEYAFLATNGFIIGPRGRVLPYIRKKCRDWFPLYQ